MAIYYAYVITNTEDDLSYVGATKQPLSIRMSKHKYNYKRYTNKFYKHLKEIGFNKFLIERLESRNCINLNEARLFEQEWIDKLKPELNSNRSHGWDQKKLTKSKIKFYQTEKGRKSIEKMKTTAICGCGGRYRSYQKSRHQRSKMHLRWLDLSAQ